MSTMQVVAYLHRSAIDGGKPQADTQHYNLADARPLVFESDALAAIQDASRAAHQARAVPAVPEGLIEVLRGGRQCDEDGTEIIMSRQACCEAADLLETMGSQPPAGQQDRCE
ncbi:MAG: hypothetical protein ACREUP_09345, partial [Burkholderiales bacterium]